MVVSQVSLNLGIDFGTKYTKVCVRDTDRDESWVVIPGEANSLLGSALILSQIGIKTDGTLVAGLTESEWETEKVSCDVIIDFLKMRLAHLDPGRQHQYWYSPVLSDFQGNNLSSCNALENLCAFFLYRIIQRSIEWICQDDPDRFKNVEVDWSVQIGVPVEYCDSPSLVRFRRVLCLAWHFYEINIIDVRFNELNDYLDDIHQSLVIDETPCLGIPEIAAAVYSYTFSRQARQGVYIFFDIGGGTTEGAAFKFYRTTDDQPKIDFLSGLVEPIGVNALAKRIAQHSNELELKVSQAIVNRGERILSGIEKVSKRYASQSPLRVGDHIANKYRVSTKVVKKNLNNNDINLYLLQILILSQALIHRQVATVIRTCCKKLPYGERTAISVFLGGGGKVSAYYQDTIYATYDAFQLSSTGMPRYRMLDVPRPRDFDMKGIDEQHFHRFSIAYGLSIPDYQAPEFRLPRQFRDTPPLPVGQRWIPETALDDG
ncbi:hypothetical protein K4A83_06415 [Spirulina subsalsa FACHB-351]|uniref:Hsp70 family protein n=1 Tax=Spirulina subsalsa FACHB-351 TaxID=234711 RepID=A0ABT3L4J6_9CYAN|nr:hypothetical protein [Spirulina subsalsa]MCW6035905.1 hypothetical protein [Spirulina subsalsa FACHB-351]